MGCARRHRIELTTSSFSLVPLFCTALLLAAALTGSRARAARTRRQFELYSRPLDKVSPPKELRQFRIRKPANGCWAGAARPAAARKSNRLPKPRETARYRPIPAAVLRWCSPSTAEAAGPTTIRSIHLVSAAVAYVLSKRWGFFNGQARVNLVADGVTREPLDESPLPGILRGHVPKAEVVAHPRAGEGRRRRMI
jgi:hypothetical protein